MVKDTKKGGKKTPRTCSVIINRPPSHLTRHWPNIANEDLRPSEMSRGEEDQTPVKHLNSEKLIAVNVESTKHSTGRTDVVPVTATRPNGRLTGTTRTLVSTSFVDTSARQAPQSTREREEPFPSPSSLGIRDPTTGDRRRPAAATQRGFSLLDLHLSIADEGAAKSGIVFPSSLSLDSQSISPETTTPNSQFVDLRESIFGVSDDSHSQFSPLHRRRPEEQRSPSDLFIKLHSTERLGLDRSLFQWLNLAVGVDNTFRRKFDRDEYLQRAREREEKEESRLKSKSKGPPVQRKPLKHRDYEVDLESRLGKTQVVTPIAPLSQQAGYYCSVCECVVKDSANYLDHINGKKHQRALGMSMRVERASLEQVQQRFEVLKKRKTTGTFSEQDLDERILKQQLEEEERKRQRRERKKEKKKDKSAEEETEMDPDVAAMMGFGGFRSSKK
ncbi:hypothetical protein Dimus_012109 [Dionaea muscipula]